MVSSRESNSGTGHMAATKSVTQDRETQQHQEQPGRPKRKRSQCDHGRTTTMSAVGVKVVCGGCFLPVLGVLLDAIGRYAPRIPTVWDIVLYLSRAVGKAFTVVIIPILPSLRSRDLLQLLSVRWQL